MACKHKEIIRFVSGRPEYYCKAFGKEITEYKCKDCMMRIEEDTDKQLYELFGKIFGKGFGN